ncbi:MAG: radical SAM protein [Spirochaetes bacterium]|nr:radical SAM protein [Spirochaetota bacterium]
MLDSCTICPFRCGVDRRNGKDGKCGAGRLPEVASVTLHHGEEPPISGSRGSGTIFFSHCPLHCIFCQNYPISQLGNGNEYTIEKLAGAMLDLQRKGAHNINLVTPTHYAPQIAASLLIAKDSGLDVPVVYNTSGYETVETLRLLEGFVDVYLTDMKYGSDANALRYSGAPGYVERNIEAVREMFRQTGTLEVDGEGIAIKGTVVRHLVLPHEIAGTREVLRRLASLSKQIPVSLMAQYFPAHLATGKEHVGRKVTREEYKEAVDLLWEYGFTNGWTQEKG